MQERKRIGDFFIDRKVLTPAQVKQILDYGKNEGLRFGEAGLRLGVLTEEKLIEIFGGNYRVDFFNLEPAFFPKQTKSLLSVDTILKYGVLPLGLKSEYGFFKKGKILNLGMLDPGNAKALDSVKAEANRQEEISSLRVYLVLAEQFLEVLKDSYGVGAREISARPAVEVDRTLALFLDSEERNL